MEGVECRTKTSFEEAHHLLPDGRYARFHVHYLVYQMLASRMQIVQQANLTCRNGGWIVWENQLIDFEPSFFIGKLATFHITAFHNHGHHAWSYSFRQR